MFDMRDYKTGDESTCELSLFKPSTIYKLEEGCPNLYTIFENNKAVAFMELVLFDEKYFSIGAFEVLKKNNGTGTAIIQELLSCEEIERIHINPLPSSISFWEKCGFVKITDEDWEWRR